MGHCIRLV
uniref:Uncharacterized protein n=1 Tax=Leersia perrieri TaxID=77586 RepID=A0A0G2KBI1_9ORYZ